MNDLPSAADKPSTDRAVEPVKLAKASLQESLTRFAKNRESDLSPELRRDLEILENTLAKLAGNTYAVAVFGLVSRGKSAVLNALLGKQALLTGVLNGVTRVPRSVTWKPLPTADWQIEAIDTPGLDEIDGETRAKMAREVANQADLILFIVAGEITALEYSYLCDLRQAQKPILLVFNKSDLYPEMDREQIYQQLQSLAAGENTEKSEMLQRLLSANEVVTIAADPAPEKVRIDRPDGSSEYIWEDPAPRIEALRDKLIELFSREGESLLAINALVQAREAEENLTESVLDRLQGDATRQIWNIARWKALAIALNPIPFFDLIVGIWLDGWVVQKLTELYDLPTSNYALKSLASSFIFSGTSILVAEVISRLVFGQGAGDNLWTIDWQNFHFLDFSASALLQAIAAILGIYRVGNATRTYIAGSANWGKMGANTIARQLLEREDGSSLISRLRNELL
jgi:uncharacterized protein